MSETSLGTAPTWLQQAYRSYEELRVSPNDSTYMERALVGADILEQSVKRTPTNSIAVIGVGFENERVIQCVIPPVFAARMANLGNTSFQMLLVDLNPDADGIVRKKEIYAIPLTDEQRGYWERYLSETKQQDRLVSKPEKDLVFISEKDRIYLARSKVRAAVTPSIYQTKLANGDISVVRADVAQGGWAKASSLDYIDCRCVLMHLPKEGQQLALWHISQSLRPGKLVVLNDRSKESLNILFKENGGWLDTELMKDFSLTDVTKTFQLPGGSNIRVLQKLP